VKKKKANKNKKRNKNSEFNMQNNYNNPYGYPAPQYNNQPLERAKPDYYYNNDNNSGLLENSYNSNLNKNPMQEEDKNEREKMS